MFKIEWQPEDVKTLADARAYVYTHLHAGDMVHCLACDQSCYVWAKSINSTMANDMIKLYNAVGTDWGHLSSVLGRPAVSTIHLHYWGLIEALGVRAPDGNRSGTWRITPKGERWVRGETTVSKYAMTYNKELWRLEGPSWSVYDALGTRFNYDELMGRQ